MNVQSQKGGDSSTNIQAQTVHLGVTYTEARQIAEDVFRENILKFSAEAKETALKRAFELSEKFLVNLQGRKPEALSVMVDPDMQCSLFDAQRSYARAGNEEVGDLLVELLVERASQPKRDIMQLVLNESLSVAAKLTVQEMDALTLIFLMRHAKLKTVLNREAAAIYINNYYLPFTSDLTKDLAVYLHLEYCGCSHLGRGFSSIGKNWIDANNPLFQIGFNRTELDLIRGGDDRFDQLLMPCENNPSLYRLRVENHSEIKPVCDRLGIVTDSNTIHLLSNLFFRYTMGHSQADEWLKLTDPRIGSLLDTWNRCIIKCYTLTHIGIVIGHANFRRRVGPALDLEWDKGLSAERHWSVGMETGDR